jgi:hypothetical protein
MILCYFYKYAVYFTHFTLFVLYAEIPKPKPDGDTCSLVSETSETFYGSPSRGMVSDGNKTISASDLRTSPPTSLDENQRSLSFPSPESKRAGLRKLSVSTSLKSPHLHRSDSSLSTRSNPSPEIMEGGLSPFETRTLPNVLRRISNLIAMGSHVS